MVLIRAGLLAALAAGALIGSLARSVHAPGTARPGQTAIQRGSVAVVAVPSQALGTSRTTVIYLPPGYSDAANRARRYPVLYLLSGAPGAARDWFRWGQADQTADRLIAAGAIRPLIMVSPDGHGGPGRDSQFVDSFDGRQRVETFLAHDLLEYVDSHYRTLPTAAARGLAGYSAGAYGALNVGLHHPDLFGTLAGFCGYYAADPKEVAHPNINNPLGNDPAFLRRNSPSVTITTLGRDRWPHIFLFDTTNDTYLTRAARSFDAELTRLGVPHAIDLYPPLYTGHRFQPHTWTFVAYAFGDQLPALAATLQGGAR